MPQTGHSFWFSAPISSPSSPTVISGLDPDFLGGSYRYFCAHSSHRWCSSNCSSPRTSVICIVAAALEHFWHLIIAAPRAIHERGGTTVYLNNGCGPVKQ